MLMNSATRVVASVGLAPKALVTKAAVCGKSRSIMVCSASSNNGDGKGQGDAQNSTNVVVNTLRKGFQPQKRSSSKPKMSTSKFVINLFVCGN